MRPETSPGRFLPYPELVEPLAGDGSARVPYQIGDSREAEARSSGSVDKVARRMLVPLEPYGRATARHELGHVRWSPQRPPPVRFDARVLASVEDARINLALAARGLPLRLGAEGELHVAWLLAGDLKRGDTLAVWLRSIASLGTSAEPALRLQLAAWPDEGGDALLERMDRIRDKLEEARAQDGLEAAPERRGRALARELARALRASGVLDARGQSASAYASDCCVVVPCDDAGEDAAEPHGHSAGEEREDADVAAGRMRITRAPLTRALPIGKGPVGWRAAREGSVVRYAHRWLADRAIFRRRGRGTRGSVLIDGSGSMSLGAADLDRLLASARAGLVVAVYSGKGEEGELRIVAAGARRADTDRLKTPGSGNIVDLPALEWLARQPAPRVWVSDAGVTGIGDRPSKALRARCLALCRRAGIRRVERIDEAAGLLGAGRAPVAR